MNMKDKAKLPTYDEVVKMSLSQLIALSFELKKTTNK